MKIVILGYSGVIGKSVLKLLLKKKYLNLLCVGRNIQYKKHNYPSVKYHKLDLSSFENNSLSFLDSADVIINCAGKADYNIKDIKKLNILYLKKLLNYINSKKQTVRFIQLGSVSVYGGAFNYLGKKKSIQENSPIKINNNYSKSKFKADMLIQGIVNKKVNKNFSYTILRVSNVFSDKKKSNLFKYLIYTLRLRFWIRSFEDVTFNFINVKDVSRSIVKIISNLSKTKNKIYIVSDDCDQSSIYNEYEKINKKKIIRLKISIKIVEFIIHYFQNIRKLINFILIVSSRITYNNTQIKKDINFCPKFSLQKNVNKI